MTWTSRCPSGWPTLSEVECREFSEDSQIIKFGGQLRGREDSHLVNDTVLEASIPWPLSDLDGMRSCSAVSAWHPEYRTDTPGVALPRKKLPHHPLDKDISAQSISMISDRKETLAKF